MLTVLVQSVALASVGLFSPGSITMVILLLMSGKGWRNGVGYALGYVSMYTLIGATAILLGVGSAETASDEQSLTTSIVLTILGLLLLTLGLRSWRKPPSENSTGSRFSTILDKITPIRAFGFGSLVSIINFKNLAIFLTSLSILLVSDLAIPTKLIILIPLVLVFCMSVIMPILIYVAFPTRANEYLTRIKQTIEKYSRPIGIWLPIIFGALLLLRGLQGF